MPLKLQTANLTFNEQGTPTSSEFDDVYFSNHNGLEESKYVFFDHNLLNQRFFSHQASHFTIAETGFGTGLNFLLTAKLFLQYLQKKQADNKLQRLFFITTEKYPIDQLQLKKALQQWPELEDLSEQLLVQYPTLTPGCHRLAFANHQIFLDLWLGDVNDTLKNIAIAPDRRVDAWYLDGFAPGKNPDMWQPALFQQMARLSKPQSTFATFTAAGIVKRGLRDNGFIVNKVKGFGRKRDMLAGYFAPEEAFEKYSPSDDSDKPGTKPNLTKPLTGPWHRHQANAKSKQVAIIGAGLAGANCALALSNKGYAVDIYCADPEPAMGASGNHLGGFYPSLNADFSLQSQFYCHAFGYARRHYDALANQGLEFGHDWCGVFFPAFSDEVKKRQQKLIENNLWPGDLIQPLDSQQAQDRCGIHMPYEGLFIPQGGWLHPEELVKAIISRCAENGTQLYGNKRLEDLKRVKEQWQLHWSDGEISTSEMVVLATGAESVLQAQLADIPFTRSRGQVEYIKPSDKTANIHTTSPRTVICHKGYFTPVYKGYQAMGATFDKHNFHLETSESDTEQNLATIKKALAKCDWVDELLTPVDKRAAIRCSLPDHRPIMGAVPNIEKQKQQYAELYKALPIDKYPQPENEDNLFVLTGLGSHGLCTSPLLAEALACQISGEPLPLNEELLASLSPNRFLVRNLIRRITD